MKIPYLILSSKSTKWSNTMTTVCQTIRNSLTIKIKMIIEFNSVVNYYMKRRQQKISTILDKLYDQEEKEFVYLVKREGSEYIHDTWEKESWLLQNAPDPLFKYND